MTTLAQSLESEMAATALGHRWEWLVALGVVQIIAGSIAIAVPVVASLAAVAVFGALLIMTAIFQTIYAFKIRARPRSALYEFGGIPYAIAGLLVVIYPIGGALTLAVMIAILLIADRTPRVGFAMTVRPLAGWGWFIAAGLGSILVGVILLIGWPKTALWVTGLLLAVNLIFTGAMYATLALTSRLRAPVAARGVQKKQVRMSYTGIPIEEVSPTRKMGFGFSRSRSCESLWKS
jgi:uncharacterized membrane protein HdeD (DUF308 family)